MSKEWKGQSNNLIHIDADTRDAPCILIDGRLIIGTYEDSHSTLVHKVIYGMGSENEDWESLIDAGMPWRRNNIKDEDVAYGHVLKHQILWDVLENSTNDILSKLRSCMSKIDDYNHMIVDPNTGKYSRILK